MEAFMTALSGKVTAADLWAGIAPAALFIGSLILFAFAYTVLRKVVKGAAKGKAKI